MTGTSAGIEAKKGKIDSPLLFTVFLIVLLGILMIFSSSGVKAEVLKSDPFYFVKKQIIWSIIGFSALFMTMQIEYHNWRKLQYPFIITTFILLVAVLLVGRPINGAIRWISLGPATIQPSELAKMAVVLYLAGFIERKGKDIRNFTTGVVPPVLFFITLTALIIKEPDFGTVMFLVALGGAMLFIGGIRIAHIVALALPVAVFGVVAVVTSAYRWERIKAYINPWANKTGDGFQLVQSFMAFSSGKVLGQGIGLGRNKLFFLPENHTDFIFAAIGEELGFLGCILVIMIFLMVFWRGIAIAREAPDTFGTYLAYGFTYMITLHAVLNMGVVTGILPPKGLPLPFLSYGGSSLVLNLAAVGILLNISKYRQREYT